MNEKKQTNISAWRPRKLRNYKTYVLLKYILGREYSR